MNRAANNTAARLPSARPVGAVNRIIVGTDFSASASLAVERAAQLAAEHSARLEIVHVTRRLSPVGFTRRVGGGAPAWEEVERGLEAARAVASSHGATASVRTLQGATAPALARHATQSGADLLVVGVGETRTLSGMVVGTTAERLVEAWPGHTLVVQRPEVAPYRTVLACVALAPISPAVLELGAALRPEAELHVMHAYLPPFEGTLLREGVGYDALASHRAATRGRVSRELTKLIASADVGAREVQAHAYHGAPADSIFVIAVWTRADLIVVGKNRSRIGALFLRSIAKHVVSGAPVDVLVCGTMAANRASVSTGRR